MPNPAISIALLMLGLLSAIALITWFLKSRIQTFANAINNYREKIREASEVSSV